MKTHLPLPAIALLLSACVSPPPPQPVPWSTPGSAMNTTLPQWSALYTPVPSASVTGSWSVVIRAFNPDDPPRSPALYYAVAHSSRITVTAPQTATWFRTKYWLRQHGARDVIGWQPAQQCLTCADTRIYLSR